MFSFTLQSCRSSLAIIFVHAKMNNIHNQPPKENNKEGRKRNSLINSPEEITELILRQIEENREKNARRMSEIENRQKRIRFIYEFINQKMLDLEDNIEGIINDLYYAEQERF
uniref:Uncharacterized protein n=1 Tax=Magallana gigas TaxID=29159 RepID=A0A8W8MGN7_MAGGI|nr:uncharacterized protein LOC109620932 [Crassostrea gigas]